MKHQKISAETVGNDKNIKKWIFTSLGNTIFHSSYFIIHRCELIKINITHLSFSLPFQQPSKNSSNTNFQEWALQ